MTQSDIADACGLTNVHVSRVLRSLRLLGILEMIGSQVTILDPVRLQHLGEIDPHYLYISDKVAT